MAVTAEHLSTMEAAFYGGIKSVTFAGRTVTYQDMDSLWRAIALARQELQALATPGQGAGALRPMRFTTLRGF